MSFRLFPRSVLGKRTLAELYCLHQNSAQRPSRKPLSSFTNTRRSLATGASQQPQLSPSHPVPPLASRDITEKSSPRSSNVHGDNASLQHGNSTDRSSSDWEENPDLSISRFSELPSKYFGANQHMIINEEFKEALRQILWQFKAPIRYAFAYGSGVFTQSGSAAPSAQPSCHPSPPEAIGKVQKSGQKMIDFIFGVSHTQHWHSLNLHQHRDHYSALGSLGSYMVSRVQDSFGSGVYFNPFITVNGTLIKYGVVNLDTLCRDLSEWDTLYLAGRLQKPVKILRDHPGVRVANQINLLSAVRTALLLLPPHFTEQDLYATIAGISYLGDPRMALPAENPRKVINIVAGQITNFRRLYKPLIEQLPNLSFNDPQTSTGDWDLDESVNARLAQDMDPVRRGNMVRRLPKQFREKLYFEYQAKYSIPRGEFNKMLEACSDEDPDRIKRREGTQFDQKIAQDHEGGGLKREMEQVIRKTIRWPSTVQSLKSVATAGVRRSWRYAREKREKARVGRTVEREEREREKKTEVEGRKDSESEKEKDE